MSAEKKLDSNILNPFHVTCLFPYPLKTSENLWFSDVLRGIEGDRDMKTFGFLMFLRG